MTVYIGVDLHPYQQTVCYCDTADGLVRQQTLFHHKDDLRAFYAQFSGEVVVGIEACGDYRWFKQLLAGLNHRLLVGHPTSIRHCARSRHKSDRRDAELLLELLMQQQFPAIWQRSAKSEEVIGQLRFRDALVKQRTRCCNRLQALARTVGLPRAKVHYGGGRQRRMAADLPEALRLQRDGWSEVLSQLQRQITAVDARLAAQAAADEAARLLQTHPGVGVLTALCVTHSSGDVIRFRNARQVVAFAGLDPVEHSSGERKQWGRISKAGSRLLRYLLGQDGQQSLKADAQLRSFYQRISARRGKAVAKVATARKLLIRFYVMLRDRVTYAEFIRRGVEVGLPA
jgi:transposase